MIYEFLDTDGNLIEINMPMSCAPSIGGIIEHDGKSLTRIASISVQIDAGANRSQYPYVSNALPRNLEGCKTAKGGKPIIMSKSHERNVMARHGYVKD